MVDVQRFPFFSSGYKLINAPKIGSTSITEFDQTAEREGKLRLDRIVGL